MARALRIFVEGAQTAAGFFGSFAIIWWVWAPMEQTAPWVGDLLRFAALLLLGVSIAAISFVWSVGGKWDDRAFEPRRRRCPTGDAE